MQLSIIYRVNTESLLFLQDLNASLLCVSGCDISATFIRTRTELNTTTEDELPTTGDIATSGGETMVCSSKDGRHLLEEERAFISVQGACIMQTCTVSKDNYTDYY